MEPISNRPTVSVCLPVFNGAPFLPRAFSSLQDQIFKDFEVVVVDDGSTDGSGDEAQRLLALYGLTGSVIRIQNRGSARARDVACESARGDFIATLDSDDWWDPRYLQDMVAVLRSDRGVDLAYCDFLELFSDGRSIIKSDVATWVDTSRADRDGDSLMFRRGEFFTLLLRGQVLFPSCTVYARSLYQKVGGYAACLPELPTSLDWFFGLRAARVGSIAFLKRTLVKKYARAESVSNASYLRTKSSSVRILKALLHDPTLRPEERRIVRCRGGLLSQQCAYESWASHRAQIQAMRWLFRSLEFQIDWKVAALAVKFLIPRALIESLRSKIRAFVV